MTNKCNTRGYINKLTKKINGKLIRKESEEEF